GPAGGQRAALARRGADHTLLPVGARPRRAAPAGVSRAHTTGRERRGWQGGTAQDGPSARARSTALRAPPFHGSPCPGSTVRAPVSAIACSEARFIAESAVAAPATIRGPTRAVYGSRVTSASPEITASRSGKCRA